MRFLVINLIAMISIRVVGWQVAGNSLRLTFDNFDICIYCLLVLLYPILIIIGARRYIRPLRLRLQAMDVLHLLVIAHLGANRR